MDIIYLSPPGVVPVLIGPLQVLVAILPGLLLALLAALQALFKPATMLLFLRLLWRLKFQVAAIIVLISGVVYGIRMILPERTGAVGSAEGGEMVWPAFRGGLDRRGWQPGSEDPVEPGIRWRMDSLHKNFYASPSLAGNRLFIPSAEVSVFNRRGEAELYCLDADTGGVVWRSGPPGYRATFSSVAVGEKHLAVGEGLHLTKDSRITVLDRESGRMLWTYRTDSHCESSPAIGEGRLVTGAGQDGFYCFELDPDKDGNPVLLWHAPGPADYPDASGSPAIYNGRAYLPLGRWGGRAVACLDLQTGKELWRTQVPYPVFAGPTFANGQMFVGMGNGNFIQSAEQALPGELDRLRAQGATDDEVETARSTLLPGGAVWSIDPESGAVNWSVELSRAVLGQVAAGSDAIYAATRAGEVVRISYAGRITAQWMTDAPVLSSPAVADRHVYILNERGRLTCLTKDGLRPVWQMALGLPGPWIGSPTVARGMVYVGTPGGGVVAVGNPAGEQPVIPWSGALGGAGRSGGLADEEPGGRGVLDWRFSGEDDAQYVFTAPVARYNDFTYVAVSGTNNPGVVALSYPADAVRQVPPVAWSFATPHPVTRSVAVHEELLLFVDGETDTAGRSMFALNPASGSLLWQIGVEPSAPGGFRLDDAGILAALDDGGVSALDFSGERIWHSPVGTLVHEPDSMGTLIVLGVADPPTLKLLDRGSGRVLWRMPLEGALRAAPVLRADRVIVAEGMSVTARRITNGAPIWRTETGILSGGFMPVAHGHAAGVNDAGELVVLDIADGEELLRSADAEKSVSPLLFRSGILYLSKGGDWMLAGLDADAPTRWMAARWLGLPTSAAVFVDGALYYPTPERGLVRIRRRD